MEAIGKGLQIPPGDGGKISVGSRGIGTRHNLDLKVSAAHADHVEAGTYHWLKLMGYGYTESSLTSQLSNNGLVVVESVRVYES